ncbi:hypothetical protein RD792_006125 [Penstemon davidsonii]|uniref:DUF4005 domain-containing protein n=1 Tax=Penstemon davidsonii TaxID=160366 RepID=A0ABR0DE85_9LAMI|nr:hypothetical protein RD792_006125 [Penstemon davidsonii]
MAPPGAMFVRDALGLCPRLSTALGGAICTPWMINKNNYKEKKKGRETKSSFIPLFRDQPSSIEKILGEADQLPIRPPPSSSIVSEKPKALNEWPTSPNFSSRIASPRISSPKVFTTGAASSNTDPLKVITQSRKEISYAKRVEPSTKCQHLSATKIQAAYRGYQARRSFRALRGIVRLQGVVRGQNAKRQTMNAIKQMQLLVRVQTQIHSQRIQMNFRNDKEAESTMSKWTQLSEVGNNEDWNDSSLTKEEVDARSRKKVEAAIKRERAMAYAYSHQLWKSTQISTQTPTDLRSNGYPWWWNWLERQFPPTSTKNFTLTPPRPISDYKPISPRPHSSCHYNHTKFAVDSPNEALTPRSSRSLVPDKAKQFRTPNRFPPQRRPSAATDHVSLKDDDSLMSLSVPNYMTPTVSAKAKVRENSNPKERFIRTPPSNYDSKRRFSFPLTPTNIDSFKWRTKGSNKDSTSQVGLSKHNYARSIGDLSVDSVVSMPVTVGRKPFNRFV